MEKVRLRLLKVTAALDRAAIPYAVAGGNVVALWVSRVDEAAVRNTRNVDLLVRREDLEAIKSALAGIGFVYRHTSGLDMFLEGADGKARDGVHLVFAEEKVRPNESLANPAVTESEHGGEFQVMALRAGANQADRVSRQGSHSPARSARSRPDRRNLDVAIPAGVG